MRIDVMGFVPLQLRAMKSATRLIRSSCVPFKVALSVKKPVTVSNGGI
jgi:hypothetical protein